MPARTSTTTRGSGCRRAVVPVLVTAAVGLTAACGSVAPSAPAAALTTVAAPAAVPASNGTAAPATVAGAHPPRPSATRPAPKATRPTAAPKPRPATTTVKPTTKATAKRSSQPTPTPPAKATPKPSPKPTPPATPKPSPKPTPKPSPSSPPPVGSTSSTARVVQLVNAARAKAGCRPVTVNSALARAAQAHSADMARNNYFSHTSLDGRTAMQRMRAAGFTGSLMGENIAAGQTTADSVMSAWMKSSGHRANILNCGYRFIGVGHATGGYYGHYWTQDFGG